MAKKPDKVSRKRTSSGRRGRASPAAVKLQRWIDLLAVLLSHRYGRTFEQLKREVPAYATSARTASETSLLRTFERDKDELRALGIPIEMLRNSEGEELGYHVDPREMYLPFIAIAGTSKRRALSNRAFYRAVPTLVFEPDELHAVFRGIELARGLGDPLLASHCDGAERKLRGDLPNVFGAAHADDDLRVARNENVGASLRDLGKAMLRLKRVAFTYHTIGNDKTSRRTIEPFGLFFQSGHWYLAGRDAQKDAIRNFRVSRISDIRSNTKTPQTADYQIPAKFRLSTHATSRKAWELGDGEAETAIVEFRGTNGAVKAAASLGSAVRGAPRQRRFQVRRVDVFARWLLSFAGDTRPLEPPAIVEAFREAVRQTLAQYDARPA
jgi:proteasome accessory factor B